MRSALATAFCVLCAAGATQAQNTATAVRVILAEGHWVYEDPGYPSFTFGLGLDRTLNERLTVGIDATLGYAGSERDAYKSVDSNSSTEVFYSVAPHLYSVNYHTEFALGDDDHTHLYVGSFIGLRHIKQRWTINEFGPAGYTSSEQEVRADLIPVGVRLGLRGATDHGCMDLYTQLGYQVGGNKVLMDPLAGRGAEYATTAGMAITCGLAYCFGW